jgi:chromosome segregation ATPase
MITKLLSFLGLVRAWKYRAVVEKLQKADARTVKVAKHVEAMRAEAHSWKAKAAEAENRLKMLKKSLDEARKDATRQRELVKKTRAETKRIADKPQRVVDVEALQTRLAETERELMITREDLMAIEVKLDILEGAANVLDTRTRTVLGQRSISDTGAPV